MTTSSTYTVTKTAADIASSIMRALTTGRTPTANELSDIIEAINFWLFQMEGPPFFLKPGDMVWQRETADITLSSKITFDLKPSDGDCDIQIPIEILTATLKNTDNNETPMSPMTLEEFQAIPDKTLTGTPSRFLYERRLDTGKFSLDIVPAETTDVIDIVYRQPLEVITASTQTFDLPNVYYRAIKFCVADDLIPDFRVDSETALKITQKKAEALAVINSINPEQCVDYFQPGVD